ncbi:unnamed protein product [Brachionus calyciflorus]|uniref:GPN-loop GTPase 2 n=1 Tax=Brachionus calyciflorus TaxID=104777 RepID=A0A813RP37_9BILA|nr:unnamed protein product [Brachionus calyciflorus]
MTVFGQIVIGPPGSGKTKYCTIMQEALKTLGRTVFVVNLDPANDRLTYDCALNIFDLINIEDVMINCNLGPNGSLVYCVEFLEQNFDWLKENLMKITKKCERPYILFDLPGQVELYTHYNSIKNIMQKLISLDYRLCCVNLIDSYYLSDPSKFISVLLLSLSTMLQIELPHVNIFSKMDLIKQYGKLAFNLDFYTDVLDLNYLVDTLEDDKILAKYKNLNKKICDVVQDFSLLSFLPLNIQKRSSIVKCIQIIDKANGYLYGHLDDQEIMESVGGTIDMEYNDDYTKEDDDDEF